MTARNEATPNGAAEATPNAATIEPAAYTGRRRMPAIFVGHGDPMIALRHDELTEGMSQLGRRVVEEFGTPRAILMASAHWYTHGSWVQSAERPRQIYDMYGFPDELYALKYEPSGHRALTDAVLATKGIEVAASDNWGIDHGTWAPLVHMFPGAKIPVVQISVNGDEDARYAYRLGQGLAHLRDEGYLVMGSGNVVHNLYEADWHNPGGTPQAQRFEARVTAAVEGRDDDAVLSYASLPDADYAVPTPDHFLPLPFAMGAAEGESPLVFNHKINLGSMAMTGYAFGMGGQG